MNAPQSRLASLSPWVVAARILLVATVCGVLAWLPYLHMGDDTEIVSYTAPKETARVLPAESPAKPEPERLWGAIIPVGEDVWFFKLTGPPEEVVELEPKLKEFLQGIHFDSGRPTWTVPDDWKELPGNGFRLATLAIPSGKKPLELAVSSLARRGDQTWDEQLLQNVNRWRGLVTQPGVSPDELPSTIEQLTVDGKPATLVAITGVKKPDAMGGPPFARGR